MNDVTMNQTSAAARWLFESHAAHAKFSPLASSQVPATMAGAYDIQDELIKLRTAAWNAQRVGWKIALTTPQMRKFVGYDDSVAGQVLSHWNGHDAIHASPASVRFGDYGHLLFECELAFRLGRDVPINAAPPSRDEVAACIDAVAPAFELADDRHADYSGFGKDGNATLFSLAADNAWNSGVVLGAWQLDWRALDLAAIKGVATINGAVAGEGDGRDVMGHPLDAMTWIARHLHARGTTLKRGEFVITGSLITSKFPNAGDAVRFKVEGLGEVALDVSV